MSCVFIFGFNLCWAGPNNNNMVSMFSQSSCLDRPIQMQIQQQESYYYYYYNNNNSSSLISLPQTDPYSLSSSQSPSFQAARSDDNPNSSSPPFIDFLGVGAT